MTLCLTLGDVDWSLTKNIVTIIGTVVTIIGTIGALTIGAIGLTTWHRQLKGTAKYEVAKKAVHLTYQLRDAIQAVRSPMLYLRKEEVEAGRSLKEEQSIYAERMRRVQKIWAEVRTVALEAQVIWGEEGRTSFDSIEGVIRTLRAEIWLHFWLKGAYALPGATVDNNPARVAANHRMIYFASEDDEFSTRINTAIQHVESFFRERMRG